MKFCLRSRQSREYLSKADEIKVEWRDRESIIDLAREYTNARIILSTAWDTKDIDWIELQNYNVLTRNTLCLLVQTVEIMKEAQEHNISAYIGFAVSTWSEFNALKELGAAYICIAPPLTHQISEVTARNVPIRIIPNVAYDGYIPRSYGWSGAWIRPENISEFIDKDVVFEFEDCNINKEQALYRIYAESRAWPGLLSEIITNLPEKEVLNRLMDPEVTNQRLNCGQRCEMTHICHLCERLFQLSDTKNLDYYKTLNSQNQSME